MERPKANKASIPERLDRYRIESRIGSGGMGMIYKGYDERLQRPVAIKVISDRVQEESVRRTIRDRFLNEARAAGALSHPNLVQVYDYGEKEDVVYIVMEYIEGETLDQTLKSHGPLPIETLLGLARDVATGLAFAHRRGIVHRDIKPSNIMLEKDSGIAKVLDFGIAKFLHQEEMKLTSTGMVLGSTHYLSPEHITGRNLDHRSDIFCLGTVLYEVSTGLPPFRGSNSSTILYKIVHFDPPQASETRTELLPSFSNLISKCLKKKSEQRFAKTEDLVKEIKDIEKSLHQKSPSSQSGPHELSQSSQSPSFITESQLISALQTQKKLSSNQGQSLKGKGAYDTLLRENILTEDEIANIAAECLQLPWIPHGRLKSLRISKEALQIASTDILKKYCVLPFYFEKQSKTLSLVVDGVHPLSTDPELMDLFSKYKVQLYVSGRTIIRKIIEDNEPNRSQILGEKSLYEETEEDIFDNSQHEKRVLLVEPRKHYQEAMVKLFKGQETNLIMVSNIKEASTKVKNEKFHHIWVNRQLLGDELAFESLIIKTNPSCDLRYYDHLGEELFEDSIHYNKFRDFFGRIVQVFLSQGSESQRQQTQAFASLAVNIAKTVTQNQKELDEVFFSALFYQWEKIRQTSKKMADIFYGIYRFKHINNALPERYDGRGPMGLKGNQIPLASRILACLGIFTRINPNLQNWSKEQLQKLQETFDHYSGKQLDPLITSAILELIRPRQATSTKTATAIIVDSDTEYAQQLKAHLKQVKIDATICTDGKQALHEIKKSPPNLIISEVIVSSLDGFSLATQLKADEDLKKVPIAFVSHSDKTEHSTKAIQLGAEDFISKESEPKFIIAKLEKLIQKSGS